MRVAESADVLEVIFEHCGLKRLDTLKLVCKLWYDLALAMSTRWATATIAGNIPGLGAPCLRWSAVDLPDDGGLAVTDVVQSHIHFYTPNDREAHVRGTPAAPHWSIGQAAGLSGPRGLATDGTHIFVANSAYDRVLQLRISDGKSVSSIGKFGSGKGLHCPTGLALVRGGSSSELPRNGTLAADNGDRLYVADMC